MRDLSRRIRFLVLSMEQLLQRPHLPRAQAGKLDSDALPGLHPPYVSIHHHGSGEVGQLESHLHHCSEGDLLISQQEHPPERGIAGHALVCRPLVGDLYGKIDGKTLLRSTT